MKRIRILFGQNVQFLRRFFGDSIEQQNDMEVVDEIDDPVELLVFLRGVNVDVIFLSNKHSGELGLSSHIFLEYPTMTLVVVDEECRTAYIESLVPQKHPVSDVSSMGIVDALRIFGSNSNEAEQGKLTGRPH